MIGPAGFRSGRRRAHQRGGKIDWQREHFDDIPRAIRERLALICHLFPGVSPLNIRQLRYGDFQILAREADFYKEQAAQQERENARR